MLFFVTLYALLLCVMWWNDKVKNIKSVKIHLQLHFFICICPHKVLNDLTLVGRI
jgi:hypothetical protein